MLERQEDGQRGKKGWKEGLQVPLCPQENEGGRDCERTQEEIEPEASKGSWK